LGVAKFQKLLAWKSGPKSATDCAQSEAQVGLLSRRGNIHLRWEPLMSVGFTIAPSSGVKRMNESQLREKILDVVCENGVDRASVLTTQQLAGKIDSLKLLEVIEVLESSLGCSIPEEELTEANFSSVPVLLQMASRLSQGAPK
jgi:acyl carrier protein